MYNPYSLYIILILILVVIAGAVDGIRDNIELHNSLRLKWKWYDWFWDKSSWNGKKFLGLFVINGFHISKFVCFTLLAIAIAMPITLLLNLGFWSGCLITLWVLALIGLGFNLTWT